MPVGRPSLYSEALAAEICERIANGGYLTAICREEGMPKISTVLGWTEPYFTELYARAKQLRIEVMAEEIREIADTCREGTKTKQVSAGYVWRCPKCDQECLWSADHWKHAEAKTALCPGVKKPTKVEIFETETQTGDMVDRSKLQVDARKWLLSRLAADRFGDRISQEITGSLTIAGLADTVRAARKKRLEAEPE